MKPRMKKCFLRTTKMQQVSTIFFCTFWNCFLLKLRLKYCKTKFTSIFSGCKNDSNLISKGGPYYSKRINPNDFYEAYLQLTMNETIAIAHRPQDMIKGCIFGEYPSLQNCTELTRGTVKIFSPDYGVCYGFNVLDRYTDKDSVYSVYGGPKFGLQLILNIEGKSIFLNKNYFYC